MTSAPSREKSTFASGEGGGHFRHVDFEPCASVQPVEAGGPAGDYAQGPGRETARAGRGARKEREEKTDSWFRRGSGPCSPGGRGVPGRAGLGVAPELLVRPCPREGISEEGRWGSVWGEMGHVRFGHHCPPTPTVDCPGSPAPPLGRISPRGRCRQGGQVPAPPSRAWVSPGCRRLLGHQLPSLPSWRGGSPHTGLGNPLGDERVPSRD